MPKAVSFASMISGLESEKLSRLLSKVPQWSGKEGLCVPDRLCTEQCSSAEAAMYKAEVALAAARTAGAGSECDIADLTGGIGVDSWAFSQLFSRVLYNEMKEPLYEAVKANFALLGIDNAEYRCREITRDNIASVLGAFRPDVIYLDPARRSGSGRKLFLLEDCSPDVTAIQEILLETSPVLIVKVSPMADITMLARRFGTRLREIHVVGVAGECKELLCVLFRDADPSSESLKIVLKEGVSSAVFDYAEARRTDTVYAPADALPGGWIFEPSPSLLKSGGADLLCSRAGASKLAPFTHLWHCDTPSESLPFGKWRRITEVLPFSNASLKTLGARYPRCEVVSRNLSPGGRSISSEQLRSRIGAASGTGAYIIGCTSLEGGSLIIICDF